MSAAPTDGRLEIVIGDLFQDAGLTHALHSGLPLRIRIVAELWKDGFFDSQKGRAEWRASVIFDPLQRRYRISTGAIGTPDLMADSLPDVGASLQAEFSLPLRPAESGRFYYLGQIQVETLSLTDLEELQRWLKGDLGPTVSGDQAVGGSVGRGVRRMLIRMLALPARNYRVRSPVFEVDDPSPG